MGLYIAPGNVVLAPLNTRKLKYYGTGKDILIMCLCLFFYFVRSATLVTMFTY